MPMYVAFGSLFGPLAYDDFGLLALAITIKMGAESQA
jgi:hypothetical protein